MEFSKSGDDRREQLVETRLTPDDSVVTGKVSEPTTQSSTEERKIPQTGEGPNLVLNVPDTALIPDGATFYDGEDDKRCRVIRPDGTRCGATRMKATGLCPGHAGLGGITDNPKEASLRGHAEKQRRKEARLTLGISARRAATPLQASRVRAQMRANDYAAALVDRPLDDPELSTMQRQKASIDALSLLYPQVSASLEVRMPDDEEGIRAMGWQEMSQLAAQLVEG